MVNPNIEKEFNNALDEYKKLCSKANRSLIKFMDSYQSKVINFKSRIKYDVFNIRIIKSEDEVSYFYQAKLKDKTYYFLVQINDTYVQYSSMNDNYLIPFWDDDATAILDFLDYSLEKTPETIFKGNFEKYHRNINIRLFQHWIIKASEYYQKNYVNVKEVAFLANIITKEEYDKLP